MISKCIVLVLNELLSIYYKFIIKHIFLMPLCLFVRMAKIHTKDVGFHSVSHQLTQ